MTKCTKLTLPTLHYSAMYTALHCSAYCTTLKCTLHFTAVYTALYWSVYCSTLHYTLHCTLQHEKIALKQLPFPGHPSYKWSQILHLTQPSAHLTLNSADCTQQHCTIYTTHFTLYSTDFAQGQVFASVGGSLNGERGQLHTTEVLNVHCALCTVQCRVHSAVQSEVQ